LGDPGKQNRVETRDKGEIRIKSEFFSLLASLLWETAMLF